MGKGPKQIREDHKTFIETIAKFLVVGIGFCPGAIEPVPKKSKPKMYFIKLSYAFVNNNL
jgi:hypothetical protein